MTFKKQVVLSITGLTIMIVLLVGISYSFFNYSRETDNNMITTGNLVFDFKGDKDLVLNNQFPTSYEEVMKETVGNPDNNSLIIKFEVNGYNTLPNGMNFKITASLDSKDKNNIFDDSIIYAQIIPDTPTPGYSVTDYGYNEEMTFGPKGEGAPLTGINKGAKISLLTGNIHTASPDATQAFEIRIWLNSDKVLISNTVNRDSNNRAIALDDASKELVAASSEDVGKIVYRTSEFSEKVSTIKIEAESY